MGNHTCTLLQTLNTLILFSLLVSTQALAQENADTAGAQLASSATSMQTPSNNDCYRGDRNRLIILRISDISSLWHYATRILLPTPGANALPRLEMDKRKTEKGMVWRIGTGNGAVVVSANLAW